MCKGPASAYSLVLDSVFGTDQGSRLVDSVDVLVESMFCLDPSIYSPTLPKTSKLYLMFGCGFLHAFPLAVGWRHTEDRYAKFLSACILEYH